VGDDVAPRSAIPRPAWWRMVVILETLRRRGCWGGPLLPAHYSPATLLLPSRPRSNIHVIDIHPLSSVIQGGTGAVVVVSTVGGWRWGRGGQHSVGDRTQRHRRHRWAVRTGSRAKNIHRQHHYVFVAFARA